MFAKFEMVPGLDPWTFSLRWEVGSLQVWWDERIRDLAWTGPPTRDPGDDAFREGLEWARAQLRGIYASAFRCWRHFANADARDLDDLLRVWAELPPEELSRLHAADQADPGRRAARARAAAQALTAARFGADLAAQAEAAARALFTGELRGLSVEMLGEVLAAAPTREESRERLAGEGLPLVDALVELTSLAKSKREAREHLDKGAITLNGEKVGSADRLTAERLLHGSIAALRRGKTTWQVVRFV